MASLIDTSAIKNITEYPNSFKRQGAFPLERFSIFNSLEDAQDYANNNPIAYVGQAIVTAIENGSKVNVTAYLIGDGGTLIELGTAAAISGSTSDLTEAIQTAVNGLDSSVSATAEDANGQVSVLTGVTQTDGKLTAKTEVKLAKVAKTGAAADVAVSADATSGLTAGTVQGKLQDIVTALGELETNSEVTITDTATPGEGILKVYTIAQGGTTIGTINIPKDLVVTKSGSRVVQAGSTASESTVPPTEVIAGATAGDKYLKLAIANSDPVYIKVTDLVDVYTGTSSPAGITITVGADNKISATCNISGSATIATVTDGVVTIKAGVTQASGAIAQGAGSDITLAKVATTGTAADVAIVDANDRVTATTVEGAIDEIAAKANTAVQTVTGETALTGDTAKGDYISVAASKSGTTVTLDSKVKVQSVNGASTTAKGLAEASDVKSYVDIKVGTAVQSVTGDNYIDANSDSNNAVTLAAKVADAASDMTTTAEPKLATAKGVASYVEGKIDALAGTATSTALAAGSKSATSSNDVVKAVATVTVTTANGEVSSVTSTGIDVDKAGAAAKAKEEVIGTASDAKTADTIHGAKAYADDAAKSAAEEKMEYLGVATVWSESVAAVTIAGKSVTPNNGDTVTYGNNEYFWSEASSKWLPLSQRVKLAGIANGATKVAASAINGKLSVTASVNGVESTTDILVYDDSNVVKSVSIAGSNLTFSNGTASISKSDLLTALNVAEGAQVNVVDGAVDANGAALSINASKKIVLNNLILDGGSASTSIS